ncbi:MAG: 3-deoxy-manno-octulosonate cytidylyltransferase [Chlamydiia bacterium]|nr:3-deoxy-manno-octulosonate cytidylyltransferase [Chlamydiia bacterium]
MKVLCVIPARLDSSRFPKKVLSLLGEKPMLQWVWEGATSVPLFDEVLFAIDNPETARLINSFGGKYCMTSSDCPSGTDRLIELMKTGKASGDLWVNWQGDEPFIHQEMIDALLQDAEGDFDIWTLKKQITDEFEIEDPNIVKVVSDRRGKALYFSRSPIPYDRDGLENVTYYKHIGIYAYTKQALEKVAEMAPSELEVAERLEQLRFLENGLRIQVHETAHESIGIDVPEDLARAMDHITTHFA